jgi:hypothetical protein
VGLRRLVEHRRAADGDFVLRVRAWPLELVNGEPLDPQLVAAKIAALKASVAPDLFRRFAPERFPMSSMAALAVAGAGYWTDLRTGERASLALRDAVFEQGVDIDDPRELRKIADSLGIDVPFGAEDTVIEDWHEGQRRGVLGSPHFFVNGHDYFCPALRIGHREGGGLDVALDESSQAVFLDDCLGGPEPARR